MSDQDAINKKYANLCVQLGDLDFKCSMLEATRLDIRRQMLVLNNTMTELKSAQAPTIVPTKVENEKTEGQSQGSSAAG